MTAQKIYQLLVSQLESAPSIRFSDLMLNFVNGKGDFNLSRISHLKYLIYLMNLSSVITPIQFLIYLKANPSRHLFPPYLLDLNQVKLIRSIIIKQQPQIQMEIIFFIYLIGEMILIADGWGHLTLGLNVIFHTFGMIQEILILK